MKNIILILSFFVGASAQGCRAQSEELSRPIPGADQVEAYLPVIRSYKLGLMVNPTSMVGDQHLVDTLIALKVPVKKIFAPEHGFRGEKGAGEAISNSIDRKSGLPVVSLYGATKKPSAEQLKDIDAVIFDIQDVGARFFTYISAMHYVMEACAENHKKFIVLDRPNPNGPFIDGPVLQPELRSYVGMHPIPLLHGLTVGELARMINGEGWLNDGLKCDLTVIPVKDYNHQTPYSLPVKPSPNLPNNQAIRLYPSLCLFEGTQISVARGTNFPFQAIGYPDPAFGAFTFEPQSIEGMAKNPPHESKLCYGVDLRNQVVEGGLDLSYLIDFYHKSDFKDKFFNSFFDKLAGVSTLKERIKAGWTEEAIRAEWKQGLEDYRKLRRKYLLYGD